MRAAALILSTCAGLWAQGGVTLEQLPELAQARAAAGKAAADALLEPYLQDLVLGDNPSNQSYLEKRYGEIAALGPEVRPRLLTMLQPADNSGEARAMAHNAAQVLALMEPREFLEVLVRYAEGRDPEARRQAISLLGRTEGDRRAVRCIARIFPELRGDPLLRALDSLRRLGSPDAAVAAAEHLKSRESRLRQAVLRYLVASRAVAVQGTVLAALRRETGNRLLPTYIEYLAATAPADGSGNPVAAEALLPLLDGGRLDIEDQQMLLRALATLAPAEHEPTRQRLRALVDSGDTSALGREAARTLAALGDDDGRKQLFRNLDRAVRRDTRSPIPYKQRAEASYSFEEWRDAARDYEQAIKWTRSRTARSILYLELARSEARRGNSRGALQALEDAGLVLENLRKEAAADRFLGEVLETKRGQAYLRRLQGG